MLESYSSTELFFKIGRRFLGKTDSFYASQGKNRKVFPGMRIYLITSEVTQVIWLPVSSNSGIGMPPFSIKISGHCIWGVCKYVGAKLPSFNTYSRILSRIRLDDRSALSIKSILLINWGIFVVSRDAAIAEDDSKIRCLIAPFSEFGSLSFSGTSSTGISSNERLQEVFKFDPTRSW